MVERQVVVEGWVVVGGQSSVVRGLICKKMFRKEGWLTAQYCKVVDGQRLEIGHWLWQDVVC